MPWKEYKPMDERLKFIARLLEGEKMAPVCREFGISQVTVEFMEMLKRERTYLNQAGALLVPRSSANAASYRSEAMAIQSSMSCSSTRRPSTSS